MAQRAEVIVYTISTNVTGSKGKGDKVLERIAEATGGRAFFPFQIRDVTDAFSFHSGRTAQPVRHVLPTG